MFPAAYPFVVLLALIVGGLLFRRSQSELRLSNSQRTGIAIAAFCGAMIGAKLPFALWDWEGLRTGVVWFSNGKTILCGIVGAYLAVEVAKRLLEVRTKTGDSFAVPVAASVSIGRLGCLAAGCCYGTPTALPWGVRFPTIDEVVRHPTQIYESLFHAAAAIILHQFQIRDMFRGQLIKLYIISYLVYRLLTEQIRPEPRYLGSLTAYQWFALVLIPVFAALWYVDAQTHTPEADPQPLDDSG